MLPQKEHSSASTSGDGSREGVISKLLGHPSQYTPQEWQCRHEFYGRLVAFCEQQSQPITAQPTVSKQTVDLFRLYMAVKQRGGFQEVSACVLWMMAALGFVCTAAEIEE